MTAEITILNRNAVALAADSAITIGTEQRQKTLPLANKIFTLSKYDPVGVMAYGSAHFCGLPLETLVKVYREELGTASLSSVDDYAKSILEFISASRLIPDDLQNHHFLTNVVSYFYFMKEIVVNRLLDLEGPLSDADARKVISDVIGEHLAVWLKEELLPGFSEDHSRTLKEDFAVQIRKIARAVFEEWKLTRTSLGKLVDIAVNLPAKWPRRFSPADLAGIVITGFPGKDVFPSLRSFRLSGMTYNCPKYIYDEPKRLEIGAAVGSAILPFAQRQWVDTFLHGVNPLYQAEIADAISEIVTSLPGTVIETIESLSKKEKDDLKAIFQSAITDKILNDNLKKLAAFRQEIFVEPVSNMVTHLPKEELAAIAESLVSLVSFRQRVTIEAETVGGPVDVALISRGDGFIWIKRKHYFEKDLNPHFFKNYYRRSSREAGPEETNSEETL